jgi:hypothetical protein
MNLNHSLTSLLLGGALVFYFAAFGLHNFMVMKANKGLPEDDQLPYSLHLRGWNRVAKEYQRFYPRSQVYPLALGCAIATLVLAVGFVVVRFWDLTKGK